MPGSAADDRLPQQLKALRGALEHSVTIQATRLQEIVDDLVVRGSLNRAEADRLVGELLTTSKGYSQGLLSIVDTIAVESRRVFEAGVAPVVAPVRATAERVAEAVRHQASRARGSGAEERAVEVDDPIPGYATLSASEIVPQLSALTADELRFVRETERSGKSRSTVLAEIEGLLGDEASAG